MAKVDVVCRYCHKTEDVKGHGKGSSGQAVNITIERGQLIIRLIKND
ncbi:hypothetical protein [Xenorhabdus sp. PB30.3]|nr:hypothetical protein [Xenorhabdus sp. PB30.3]MCC8380931.1 hypothetical protein [Xenorhabdus sp. PB30.3]